MEGHSVEDVMHAISDFKSLDMFCSIAKESVESEVLKQTKGLSKKKYYSRIVSCIVLELALRFRGA